MKKEKSQLEAFAFVSGIGIQAAATVGVCLWGGKKLDEYLCTGNFFTVSGIVLGFTAAAWSVYKRLRKV
jgi:F0F1-type ATP synthase assembly protein I